MINVPYVKEYENGVFKNPIVGSYENKFPNRRTRRASKYGSRPHNNRGKNSVVTVQDPENPLRVLKYAMKSIQAILMPDNSVKTINHFHKSKS